MPKLKLLVVCPPDHYVLRNLKPIRDIVDLVISQDKKEIERAAGDAEVVLYSGLTGRSAPLREIWPFLKNGVRWVHSLSAGVEKLLFPEFVESPVILTNARGVFKRSLAEFAVLGVLYFYKRVRRLVENQETCRWDHFNVTMMQDKVLGVVGYGEIGRECAILLKALGMKVYALRRRPQKSNDDPVVDRAFAPAELHDMLKASDVVVAAAPHTPETHHLLGEAEFSIMKPSSIVINVGRGPVIDEAALVHALENGKVGAAALDVFEHEPLPQSSPLWAMKNVLISPHCTDRTSDPDWLDLSARLFVRNMQHYLHQEELENIVDKRAGY